LDLDSTLHRKDCDRGKGGNQVPGEDLEKPGTTEKTADKTVTTDKTASSARKKPKPAQTTDADDQEGDTKATGAVDGSEDDTDVDDTSPEPGSDGGTDSGSVSPPKVEHHTATGNAPEKTTKESTPSAKATPLTKHTVGMMRFRRKKSRKRR
jgi:hypothetical protein